MEHGLLEDATDDGAVDAAGVGCVERLLGSRAVAVLDDAAALFEAGEEGVGPRDVALDESQCAELGEDQLVEQ